MKEYIVAHDLGTSGNKATLYNLEGKLIASELSTYDTHYFNANWVEQDPEKWWAAVCESTKRLLTRIDPEEVLAVSFSGQMMGCVCVDVNGSSLRPAIIWADMRAQTEEDFLKSRIDLWKFYQTTGHRISSSYGIEKLMWVKNNEPHVYKKTHKMLNAKDYIVYKMTGKFMTDYSDASSTNAFDINTFTWSDSILEAAGIEKEKLPDAKPSTTIAGEITSSIAEECGLPCGTPVVIGGGDGMCASVGAGSVSEGAVYNCLGSSSWICTTSKKPVFDKSMRTFNWAHIAPGYIGPCGTMQTAGAAFNWVKNEICKYEQRMAEESDESVYSFINAEIEKALPGANGLIFLPYLLGERSPRWNPEARGAFIGLKMEQSRCDVLRSVIEGITMNLNIIKQIICRDSSQTRMTVIGGMAKGKVQRQILADIYGMDIVKVKNLDEATSMGAAITAGVAVGAYPDFAHTVELIRTDEVVSPITENIEKYRKIMPVFEHAYDALTGVYHELAQY